MQQVPAPLQRPFSVRSHEGFEREIQKIGKRVEAAQIVLVRFADSVRSQLEPKAVEHLDRSLELQTLMQQILSLRAYSTHSAPIEKVREWFA